MLFRGEFLVCTISRNKQFQEGFVSRKENNLDLVVQGVSLEFLKTKLETKSAFGLCTILLIGLSFERPYLMEGLKLMIAKIRLKSAVFGKNHGF